MQKILLLEDDTTLGSGIRLALQSPSVQVTLCRTLAQAQNALAEKCYDLLILDINLPDGSGLDLLEQVRKTSDVPMILLTANDTDMDIVEGLEQGADDYITKPFSVSELVARVEALARRVHRAAGGDGDNGEPDQLVSGPFVLDEKSRVLYQSGKPIDLTQVEFQIMELFFRNPGTALVREKILEGVWGKGYFGDVKIVDVNIRRLRMKIEDEPSSPQHILTVWGYGYRWNA